MILSAKGNEFQREIWREYLPNKVVVAAENAANAAVIPLLRARKLIDEKPTAYVCENFVCQKPVASIEDFKKQISA